MFISHTQKNKVLNNFSCEARKSTLNRKCVVCESGKGRFVMYLPSCIHPNDVSNGLIDQSNCSIVPTVCRLHAEYFWSARGFVLQWTGNVNHLPTLFIVQHKTKSEQRKTINCGTLTADTLKYALYNVLASAVKAYLTGKLCASIQ